ncbi:unnamed protein product [Adineta steineri]|uniref:TTF-type domain-containing protein n=1 Tax=Adineta steineri TaxID=433720 RepID=A0A819Q8J3_9BILA|nr:unnamed protein product [Adineta steineri]
MSSSSPGKCPLCFKIIITKNFKRHCTSCHSSVNTKEKFDKLFLKFKESINSHSIQPSTSKLITTNGRSTPSPPRETNPSLLIPSSQVTNNSLSTPINEFLPSSPPSAEVSDSSSSKTTTSSSHEPTERIPSLSSSPAVIKSAVDVLVDCFQTDIQIKNQICGEIQYLLKQTQLISTHTHTVSDENISMKNFLIETRSSLVKLKQSISDIMAVCDAAFEKIPSISTTADALKSTEIFVSRDPSTTKVYNESELRYLVDQGPHQPKLSRYPVNESLRKINDTCHFVSRWYTDFPLVEYSPLTDSAYCFCCRLFGPGPGNEQSEDTWVSIGFKAWNKMKASQGAGKKGKIYVHNSSASHQSSFERYKIFKQRKSNIDYILDKNMQHHHQQQIQEKKSNEEVIKILIDCARFLARQDLSFRGHEDDEGNFHQLIHLLSKYNPVLDQWIKNSNNRPYKVTYMSKDSQNEFIQLLSNHVQEKNLCDIRRARYYSIMADASLDTNRQDMFSIFIRFVNEHGIPEERFVSIKQVHFKTGDGIANHILEVLNELELDTTKLIAQSYDCANNMSGEFNGVQTKISEKLQRHVRYIPCSSHRSNTVVKHASLVHLDIDCFFGILQSIYVFFTSSTKRLSVLDDTTSSNLFSLIPKTTTSIRWNAKYASIRSVYESIDEILRALDMITEDKLNFDLETRQQSNSINKNIRTFNFFTYLIFMKNLMSMTNSITTQFQAEKLDLISAAELLAQTVKLLETERSNEINLNNLILISEKKSKTYGVDPEIEFSRKHRIKKPPKRLDDNPQNGYQLTRETDAENICQMIQIQDADLLYNEVQLYKTEICQCDTVAAANSFVHYRKSLIPLLYQSYEYLMTIPVTVASVERSFSKMKLVKNRLRTKMNDERLNSLMLCSIETSILDKLNNNELVEKWTKNKTGRRI